MRLFSFFRRSPVPPSAIRLHNTLGNTLQEFAPPPGRRVRMYNCGPTVYNTQHIGNLSAFVFADILRRALEYNGLAVKQVINITDVGHLVSDADEGEDKMTKGLKREGFELTIENMRTLGERYAKEFIEDLRSLNIPVDSIQFPRASDYIQAQIALAKTLEEKGYAYMTKSGLHFDTSRFPAYGRLGAIKLEGQKEGARVSADPEKRNPSDFLLWRLDPKLGWESPWGKGFPGWHLECSAMARSILGEQIDIHTGGIEHIPVHHNNEIAQSEAATGKQFARFWLHRAHIQLEGAKIAKSEGNVVYLADVIERGYHSSALRYLFLGAHYRTPSNFTWEALAAANTALMRLAAYVQATSERADLPENYIERFRERVNDDLDTPGALAILWEMAKDATLSPAIVRAGLLEADKVLGLGLATISRPPTRTVSADDLPQELKQALAERDTARKNKDFKRADELRDLFKEKGYALVDEEHGTTVERLT
jgi:cysteinyl-tRNA synthetase